MQPASLQHPVSQRHCHCIPGGLHAPRLLAPRPAQRLLQHGGSVSAQGLRGFGGSGEDAKATSREWQVPGQLLAAGKPAAGQGSGASSGSSTVYTLRLSTSWDRGAALSEPLAGVHVCLVGKSGSAVLHRIQPFNDPADHARMMQDICSSVGDEVGADCSILGSIDQAPSWPAGKEPTIKQRFQEGSVDEVSFVAPDLGPLAAILVAPESGSWVCDEVDVYSSRSNHTDRFVCRTRLGGRKGEPAAYLTPVPPNAVVYGTGPAARVISKEQAAVLQELSMVDYQTMKLKLLLATALLTAGGSGVAALTSGADAAVPFAVGGAAGLAYQWLLQLGADAAVAQAAAASGGAAALAGSGSSGVDGNGSSSSVSAAVSSFSAAAARSRGARVPAGTLTPPFLVEETLEESFKGRMVQVLGSSVFRLLLLTTATVLAVAALQDGGTDPAEGPRAALLQLQLRPVHAWQLGLGLCGFMMFKVAVLGVTLSTPPSTHLPEPQRLEENVQ